MRDFYEFLTTNDIAEIEVDEHTSMKKVNFKQKKSKGSRDGEDDLSSDYKGHISNMGTVEPFKLAKKGKEATSKLKPVSEVLSTLERKTMGRNSAKECDKCGKIYQMGIKKCSTCGCGDPKKSH